MTRDNFPLMKPSEVLRQAANECEKYMEQKKKMVQAYRKIIADTNAEILDDEKWIATVCAAAELLERTEK